MEMDTCCEVKMELVRLSTPYDDGLRRHTTQYDAPRRNTTQYDGGDKFAKQTAKNFFKGRRFYQRYRMRATDH